MSNDTVMAWAGVVVSPLVGAATVSSGEDELAESSDESFDEHASSTIPQAISAWTPVQKPLLDNRRDHAVVTAALRSISISAG